MKCIHCQNDSKHKDRSDGKCSVCRHAFAFEPQAGDPVTDGAFKSAIDHVSSNGSVQWTIAHLYYEVAKHKRRTRTTSVFLGVIGLGTLAVGIFAAHGFFVATIFFWLVALTQLPDRAIRLSRETFDALWRRWVTAHGPPPALVVRRSPPKGGAPRVLPADVAEYSFDRAVICDRAETVDLLLANNFHFENNCAVLWADGYPPQAFETVRAMLRRNPKLDVFVLHDASVDGCRLARRLRTASEWFVDSARIIDVGLSPKHARRFSGLWTPQSRWTGDIPSLSRGDNAWLARYSLALEAMRPEQVIKRLFRAISGLPEANEAPASGGLMVLGDSFGTDASASDGGGDAFG